MTKGQTTYAYLSHTCVSILNHHHGGVGLIFRAGIQKGKKLNIPCLDAMMPILIGPAMAVIEMFYNTHSKLLSHVAAFIL